MYRVAVIGLGGRGRIYGGHLNAHKDVVITSVCDKSADKIDNIKNAWKVPGSACFTDEDAFFAQGRVADLMVIATQDREHYRHAVKALSLGYDLLLEKPVSPDVLECLEIERLAREKGRRVLVCHVLRYSAYYRKIKSVIDSGALGEIKLIRHDENIAWWHFSHSYVRGNWRREDETSPMLLAKCCHDTDLLYWFSGSKCKSVASSGSLTFFNREHAPAGAADNCFVCPLAKTCIYECSYQYVGRKGRRKRFPWGAYAFCTTEKKGDIIRELREGERGKLWSRCVFGCDNDVADCQTVSMEMENGIRVSMTVNAFNDEDYRHIEILGTKGTLIADDRLGYVTLVPFDGRKRRLRAGLFAAGGHYGGDGGIARAAADMMKGRLDENGVYTWIADTVESHRIVAAAEKSRRNGGARVLMSEIPDIES